MPDPDFKKTIKSTALTSLAIYTILYLKNLLPANRSLQTSLQFFNVTKQSKTPPHSTVDLWYGYWGKWEGIRHLKPSSGSPSSTSTLIAWYSYQGNTAPSTNNVRFDACPEKIKENCEFIAIENIQSEEQWSRVGLVVTDFLQRGGL